MLLKEIVESKKLLYSDEELNKIIKTIKKDCGFYLKEIENNIVEYPLYRGENGVNKLEPVFRKQKVRKDRKPSNTPKPIHDIINNFLFKKFGIKHRSESIFLTSDSNVASSYGTSNVLVFPIGSFKFAVSPEYDDIFNVLDDEGLAIDDITDEEKQEILTILKKGNYVDGNLKMSIYSKHEIMINCDEYYILNIGRNHKGAKLIQKQLADKLK